MAFSGNNQSLYNAALRGYIAGTVRNRPIVDPTSADYAATIGNPATAFATEVDSLIVADAQLTAAGATIVPGTAAQQQAALAKPGLMQAIAESVASSPGGSTTAAAYLVQATACAALYAQGVTQMGAAPGGTSIS